MMPAVVSVTETFTKSDLSRWTRAHADVAGINWTVTPGPGGTMVITELEADRRELAAAGTGAAS